METMQINDTIQRLIIVLKSGMAEIKGICVICVRMK